MSKNSMIRFTAILITAAALSLPAAARAENCPFNLNPGDCVLTVHTSIWTGNPTIICAMGVPVIRFTFTVQCGEDLCSALPAPILVCGNSTDIINFNACGDAHSLKLRHGFTWADAVTNCDAFRLQ